MRRERLKWGNKIKPKYIQDLDIRNFQTLQIVLSPYLRFVGRNHGIGKISMQCKEKNLLLNTQKVNR